MFLRFSLSSLLLLLCCFFNPQTTNGGAAPAPVSPSVIDQAFIHAEDHTDWKISQTIYLTNVLFEQINSNTVGSNLWKYLDPSSQPGSVSVTNVVCIVADALPKTRHPFRSRFLVDPSFNQEGGREKEKEIDLKNSNSQLSSSSFDSLFQNVSFLDQSSDTRTTQDDSQDQKLAYSSPTVVVPTSNNSFAGTSTMRKLNATGGEDNINSTATTCTVGPSNTTCKNDGTPTTTTETNIGDKCTCDCSTSKGYRGTWCEEPIPCTKGTNDKPCINDGNALGEALDCSCECAEGYSGLHCEMDILYDCDLEYQVLWKNAKDLYVRFSSMKKISSNVISMFELYSFEKILNATYRFEATTPFCQCPSLDTNKDTDNSCPCPTWYVIENISNVEKMKKMEEATTPFWEEEQNEQNIIIDLIETNTITTLFEVVHASFYETTVASEIRTFNSTWLEEVGSIIMSAELSSKLRLLPEQVTITGRDDALRTTLETTTSSSETSGLSGLSGTIQDHVGVSTVIVNVTVTFDYGHELMLPLQIMMKEIPFTSWFLHVVKRELQLDEKQTLRASSYLKMNSGDASGSSGSGDVGSGGSSASEGDFLYPSVRWKFQEWEAVVPEICYYETEDMILMMFNEIWCWFRDLNSFIHMIIVISVTGLTTLITLIILGSNYVSQQRFCCDTCRCCTEMGRKFCKCCPCCSVCRCCRCCILILEDQKEGDVPIWCDCSGCKNNCQGNGDDDDDEDDSSVMPSITIKGRTKSVHLQMSKIVPVKSRPVGAPAHIIAEMFSFEDVSIL